MIVRRACQDDLPGINELLSQVLELHHAGRPDLFKTGTRKYTDEELLSMIEDDELAIFVAVEEDARPGSILGYAFCEHQSHPQHNILTDIRTLYIDDLCVDASVRGQHIGSRLYEHVLEYAADNGFYNVTLNVWACNESARLFYEPLGLVPQKFGLEHIL